MPKAETSPVESVDRALLLLLLMRERGPVSVKTAAEHLAVAPSTAHRLLSALAFRGFVSQDRERRYRLGPALMDRSMEPFSISRLREYARGPLLELHSRLGETVQLMVLRGGNIQFIDGVESESSLRVGMRIGDQMPAFVSAGGKAILAQLSNAELEELYRNGLPAWPTSRITTMAMLKRSMTKVRRAEFGTNFEETEQGVSGVGVSIGDVTGRPVAAVTVATPSIRFRRVDMAVHVAALRQAAASIEERIAQASR
ncbi:IclR family transcriptional regulator [Arthrobacter sp. I2-34]|uniref:IclR family transcriptional regulator n=1 Tax=Arthrobacter hankyongi TaxID=2904801 RepID=A0ABS9L3H8_9MICC|nr:IclR family transcriptional regulator [Arthrobacter hankyongi]MCG2621178.1 IclR family transcriptional regulator [Arthrobacter hankyongi]